MNFFVHAMGQTVLIPHVHRDDTCLDLKNRAGHLRGCSIDKKVLVNSTGERLDDTKTVESSGIMVYAMHATNKCLVLADEKDVEDVPLHFCVESEASVSFVTIVSGMTIRQLKIQIDRMYYYRLNIRIGGKLMGDNDHLKAGETTRSGIFACVCGTAKDEDLVCRDFRG